MRYLYYLTVLGAVAMLGFGGEAVAQISVPTDSEFSKLLGSDTSGSETGIFMVEDTVVGVIEILGGLALLWMGWFVVRGLIRRFRGGGA